MDHFPGGGLRLSPPLVQQFVTGWLTKDDTTITHKTYGSGKDGAKVVLVVIEGCGHTWPGQKPRVRFLGKSAKDVSVNDLMWEFFQKHPMT